MRDIKFRVWNADAKRFHYWGFIEGGFVGISTGKGMTLDDAHRLSEQFTGLKDKAHDKEIYEGDIVKHQNGFLYVVEWAVINAWWCLVQIRAKDTPYTGGISGQDIWRCEVIGNIHENPALMEVRVC
jgi:uncharacterized phage protein (TIGR01671 family)